MRNLRRRRLLNKYINVCATQAVCGFLSFLCFFFFRASFHAATAAFLPSFFSFLRRERSSKTCARASSASLSTGAEEGAVAAAAAAAAASASAAAEATSSFAAASLSRWFSATVSGEACFVHAVGGGIGDLGVRLGGGLTLFPGCSAFLFFDAGLFATLPAAEEEGFGAWQRWHSLREGKLLLVHLVHTQLVPSAAGAAATATASAVAAAGGAFFDFFSAVAADDGRTSMHRLHCVRPAKFLLLHLVQIHSLVVETLVVDGCSSPSAACFCFLATAGESRLRCSSTGRPRFAARRSKASLLRIAIVVGGVGGGAHDPPPAKRALRYASLFSSDLWTFGDWRYKLYNRAWMPRPVGNVDPTWGSSLHALYQWR